MFSAVPKKASVHTLKMHCLSDWASPSRQSTLSGLPGLLRCSNCQDPFAVSATIMVELSRLSAQTSEIFEFGTAAHFHDLWVSTRGPKPRSVLWNQRVQGFLKHNPVLQSTYRNLFQMLCCSPNSHQSILNTEKSHRLFHEHDLVLPIHPHHFAFCTPPFS